MDIPTDQLLVGVAAATAVALAARRLHALTLSGAAATTLLGAIVFGVGGIAWAVPLLVFFTLSSLLSRVSKRRVLHDFTTVFEKGGQRDAGQVVANGGVAGAVVLLNLFFPNSLWYPAFVGAIAAAAADTWGTEIGVLGSGSVRSILTFRLVPPGTSGGVSAVGSVGCCAGACSVALSGALFVDDPTRLALAATVAGVAGAFADSLLGATLQAGYRCPRCLSNTERKEHCGAQTELVRGVVWVNNDLVNLACCVVGGAAAGIVLWAFGWKE